MQISLRTASGYATSVRDDVPPCVDNSTQKKHLVSTPGNITWNYDVQVGVML